MLQTKHVVGLWSAVQEYKLCNPGGAAGQTACVGVGPARNHRCDEGTECSVPQQLLRWLSGGPEGAPGPTAFAI